MTYTALQIGSRYAVVAVCGTFDEPADAEALAASLNAQEWTPELARLGAALGPLEVLTMKVEVVDGSD